MRDGLPPLVFRGKAVGRQAARILPPCSRAFSRLRIKLPLIHARDRNAGEHAGLREWIAVYKSLRFGAGLYVHD